MKHEPRPDRRERTQPRQSGSRLLMAELDWRERTQPCQSGLRTLLPVFDDDPGRRDRGGKCMQDCRWCLHAGEGVR
jgi:hypothetical protein